MPQGTKVGTFAWVTALDNYVPARDHAGGTGEIWETPHGVTLVLCNAFATIRDPDRCHFIVDSGDKVEVMYVSGWAPADQDRLYLQPFPVNGATRPDSGRSADFSEWRLGPRRAYHLKLHTAAD